MTTPISTTSALPALDRASGAAEATAPTDAFAALLAALSGVAQVPLPGHLPPGCAAGQDGSSATPTAVAGPVAAPASTGAEAAVANVPLAAAAGLPVPAAGSPVARTEQPVVGLAPPRMAAAPAGAPGSAPVQRTAVAAEPSTAAAPRAGQTPQAHLHLPPPVRRQLPHPEALTAPVAPAPPGAPELPGSLVGQPTATGAATESKPMGATAHVRPALVEAAKGLRHEGGGRTSLVVRLDPPELGAVLVRLTVQDGRVDVQLRTPDLAARSDLQAQSYDVQQVLREQGLDLTSFDVAHGDVLSGGRDGTGTPDRGTPGQRHAADGRAHDPRVTDDATLPDDSGTWL